MSKPLLSVCLITYNHVHFIRQAIEGVLMQQVAFDWELIIADDCSTDGTKGVILQYQEKFPDFITLLSQEKNVGAAKNWLDLVALAKGKYIAYLDGDDYWTDPLKLHKQLSFLESNPSYSIHSGKAQILSGKEFKEVIGNPLSKTTYQAADFFTKNNLVTCTIMFRNEKFPKTWLENPIFGDWMLYVLLLSKSKNEAAYVSDEVYAVYRIHAGGTMQSLNKMQDNYVAHLKQIIAIKKYRKVFYSIEDVAIINSYCLGVFKHFFSAKSYTKSINYFFKNLYLCRNRIQLRKYLSFVRRNALAFKQ